MSSINNIIVSLKTVSLEIRNIYIKLESNILSKEEYEIEINKLKHYLKLEDSIYKNIEENSELIQLLTESIISKDRINNFSEDLRVLVNGTESEIIDRRIIIRLLEIKLEKEIDSLKNMSLEFRSIMDVDNSYEIFANLLISSNLLKKEFIIKIFNQVNSLQYRLAYLYSVIENRFILKEHVSDNNELDINYNGVKSCYGIDLALIIKNYLSNCQCEDIWKSILQIAISYCDIDEKKLLEGKRYGRNIK